MSEIWFYKVKSMMMDRSFQSYELKVKSLPNMNISRNEILRWSPWWWTEVFKVMCPTRSDEPWRTHCPNYATDFDENLLEVPLKNPVPIPADESSSCRGAPFRRESQRPEVKSWTITQCQYPAQVCQPQWREREERRILQKWEHWTLKLGLKRNEKLQRRSKNWKSDEVEKRNLKELEDCHAL